MYPIAHYGPFFSLDFDLLKCSNTTIHDYFCKLAWRCCRHPVSPTRIIKMKSFLSWKVYQIIFIKFWRRYWKFYFQRFCDPTNDILLTISFLLTSTNFHSTNFHSKIVTDKIFENGRNTVTMNFQTSYDWTKIYNTRYFGVLVRFSGSFWEPLKNN